MAETIQVSAKEVQKALGDASGFIQWARDATSRGKLDEAFRAAELAQHAAFEAKSLIQHGGKYESPKVGERA